MDKLTIAGNFTKTIELLRNTECSQKEKLTNFHQISDQILAWQMISHVNFSKYCSSAIGVLLFFCEDLDSVVRMNAEENLYRIIRSLETNRISRILLDLYNEIKNNGNQKSLRICLNLFGYYCPYAKEKNIKWYATKIISCIQMISTRRETLLLETLSEFMKSFSKNLQPALSDNETFNLIEVFLYDITADCTIKRRCAAQNCITLMENARNKHFMAKNGINKALEFLINDRHQTINTQLGVLGYFRLLLPILISENLAEPKQIIEIYDFCLYLLDNQNHSIINASLEVINSILKRLPDTNELKNPNNGSSSGEENSYGIEEFLTNRNTDRLRHNEILKKRKSLKNQIFQLRKNSNSTCGTNEMTYTAASSIGLKKQEKISKLKDIVGSSSSSSSYATTAANITATATEFIDSKDLLSKQLQDEKISTAQLSGGKAIKDEFKEEQNDKQKQKQQQEKTNEECIVVDSLVVVDCGKLKRYDDVGAGDGDESAKEKINNEKSVVEDDRTGKVLLLSSSKLFVPFKMAKGILTGSRALQQHELEQEQQQELKTTIQKKIDEDKENSDGFTTLSELLNDSNHDTHLVVGHEKGSDLIPDDKSQIMNDIDSESFNSIDFESEIKIGDEYQTQNDENNQHSKNQKEQNTTASWKLQKSTDSIGSFFNSFLSQSNAESMTKLFRPSAKLSATTTTPTTAATQNSIEQVDCSTTSTPKSKHSFHLVEQRKLRTGTETQIPTTSISNLNVEDDTISLESINSHISLGSHVSNQSTTIQDFHIKTDQDLVMLVQPNSDYIDENYSSTTTRTNKIVCNKNEKLHKPDIDDVDDVDDEMLETCMELNRTEEMEQSNVENPSKILENTKDFINKQNKRITNRIEVNEYNNSSSSSSGTASMGLDIGTIYNQPIIYYTIRLITSKFLLTGLMMSDDKSMATPLISDSLIRVSIKNLALLVIANCVKLMPETLLLSIEIDKTELNKRIEMDDDKSSSSCCSNSTNKTIGSGGGGCNDDINQKQITSTIEQTVKCQTKILKPKFDIVTSHPLDDDNSLLLDIKDDHFGESTTKNLFDYPLSRSADPVMVKAIKNYQFYDSPKREQYKIPPKSPLMTAHQKEILSKSEIIESKTFSVPFNIIKTHNKMSPIAQKPIDKNTNIIGNICHNKTNDSEILNDSPSSAHMTKSKNIRVQQKQLSRVAGNSKEYQINATGHQNQYNLKKQFIYDILLFHNHSDPILRGDIQVIIGNFIYGMLLISSTDYIDQFSGMDLFEQQNQQHPLNMNRLLAILIKGFRDDIHTVVIHTMTTFDKIFPYLMTRYYQNHQLSSNIQYIDYDIDKTDFLKNIIQLKMLTPKKDRKINTDHTKHSNIIGKLLLQISPKFLLNEFRLCYHNKYWLVQNKYTEVVSNLKYDAIREFYSDNIICSYERMFLEEIVEVLGDEDLRVREHTAEHLCIYIMNRCCHQHQQQHFNDTNNIMSIKKIKDLNTIHQCYSTNFNLIREFLHYHIFSSMSLPICDILNTTNMFCHQIEKSLSRILYILTNKLMTINDKNMQFGIISALKILLNQYNPIDYFDVWDEFNFINICLQFAVQNYTTATDLNCQRDLIEITTKLLAGNILLGKVNNQLNDNLFAHVMKILNIFYHLFDNQKPILFAKAQKGDLFPNTKELAISNLYGYFGNDYLYIKLYNTLKGVHDNYKITINLESGTKIMSLLKTCLNTLAACLEMKEDCTTVPVSGAATSTTSIGTYSQSTNPIQTTVKLIEEILQYLNILINYEPIESIHCLRQLLKFLFARNYANRQHEYETFTKHYFRARNLYANSNENTNSNHNNNKIIAGKENMTVICLEQSNSNIETIRNEEMLLRTGEQVRTDMKLLDGSKMYGNEINKQATQICMLDENFGELFSSAMNFPLGKSKTEEECARHIKLFEPLVIFCLSLFLKSNAKVQGPILDLLSQLLEFNVTYSILDSKSMIFDQILKNLELLEAGVARNSTHIIVPIIRFMVKLTYQNDKKLMTIPKLISITNSLLANHLIKDCSILALQSLSYEIFFIVNLTNNNHIMINTNMKELNTQKEVLVGMLEKFIDSIECQKMLATLIIRENILKNNVYDIAEALPTEQLNSYYHSVDGSSRLNNKIEDLNIQTSSVEIIKSDAGENKELSFLSEVEHNNICPSSIQREVIFSIVTKGLSDKRINVNNWNKFFILDSLFRNTDKNVLLYSKGFLSLLSLFITKTVKKFSDFSIAMIILDNVILKTEEIYLVNHIKLYLKNHKIEQVEGVEGVKNISSNTTTPTTTNEIKYFAKVLYKKLDECFLSLKNLPPHRWRQHHDKMTNSNINMICNINNTNNNTNNNNNNEYPELVVKFVRVLYDNISKKDALNSAFRFELMANEFWENYNNNILECISYERLKVEVIRLFFELEINVSNPDKICMLEKLVQLDQNQTMMRNVLRTLVRKMVEKFNEPKLWSAPEIEIFLGEFLWISLNDFEKFLETLCRLTEYREVLLKNLSQYCNADNIAKDELHIVLKFINNSTNIPFECKLPLIAEIQNKNMRGVNNKVVENLIEQIIETEMKYKGKHIVKNALETTNDFEWILKRLSKREIQEEQQKQTDSNSMPKIESKIIDENWLIENIIEYSSLANPNEYVKILLDMKSEIKLKQIFTHRNFNIKNILKSAICLSFESMLRAFQNDCIQYNPHINYMNMNPLLRVSLHQLQDTIDNLQIINENNTTDKLIENQLYLPISIIVLMENIKYLENICLIYIDYRFIEKFIKDQIFKSETFTDTLIKYILICSNHIKKLLQLNELSNSYKNQLNINMVNKSTSRCYSKMKINDNVSLKIRKNDTIIGSIEMYTYLKCINVLLNEKLIWYELNQLEKYDIHLEMILDLVYIGMMKSIRNTQFYKKYQMQTETHHQIDNDDDVDDDDDGDDDDDDDDDDIDSFNTNNNPNPNSILDKIYDVEKANNIDGITTTGDDGPQLMLPELHNHEHRKQLLQNQQKHKKQQQLKRGEVDRQKQRHQQQQKKRNVIQKAIFIGKLIETNCSVNAANASEESSMELLKTIGISLLRMNKFYAYAVTPIEIFQNFGYERHYHGNSNSSSKLPSIPVEHLSDVDVLQKFVKRLSTFGFTTRQQFEEYFMTFLLLINTVYDENMVDIQEQFQIKSTCLEAILELLITYKTFPIVGNKLSRFHHTTRWTKITTDSISLKKLHKVQLLVPGSNIFYQSNLERNLSSKMFNFNDNIIGTTYFLSNQYDLNFVWQLMENSSSSSSSSSSMLLLSSGSSLSGTSTINELDDIKEDVHMRNFRYFRDISEIDFKSSSQLIYDVLTQFVDQNHILILPNLVKFCEICENRDQVKWIKQKVFKLQETIPIDDTISHQYIIYLLCKTQSMLIPSSSDLSHLCSLISTYLKSSHVFIRNATLQGLLCLLECCSKTNTTIGKLSEELSMLRDLIVGYITRHGIIEESSVLFSDQHTKLVWTLNFSLIELTTKFVPDCHLLSNTIISANNLLKRTTNESVYLCILHGLERIILMNIAPIIIQDKIEKLALELLKMDNEKYSVPALKLLLSCIYMSSTKQLESTELSNGIVQDDPEIIAQQTDKLDTLLHCIKSSSKFAANIYGEVLCQIIRDLVPPKEILTKVIKEFLAINQPHCDVIARIVHQVFRSAIDSSFLQMLQEWLVCTLPTFISLPEEKSVWSLTVIFVSASINLHLIKLFPVVLNEFNENLGHTDDMSLLFVTAAKDFHSKLTQNQKQRFREAFQIDGRIDVNQQQSQQHQNHTDNMQRKVFQLMLNSL